MYTPQEYRLLLLLYQFRFLTASQIMLLLHQTSLRRVRYWLKDLLQKGYIVSRTQSTHKKYYYCLTTRGRTLFLHESFAQQNQLDAIYKNISISFPAVLRYIAIADLYITFQKDFPHTQLFFFSSFEASQAQFLPFAVDGYMYVQEAEKTTIFGILFVDERNPRFVYENKLRIYAEEIRLGETQSIPHLLLSVPCDSNVKKRMMRLIEKEDISSYVICYSYST